MENASGIVTKHFATQIRIVNSEIDAQWEFDPICAQKQEFGQKRAEMWKNASRDGRHLCEIEDSFIGGRQVFGDKSVAI